MLTRLTGQWVTGLPFRVLTLEPMELKGMIVTADALQTQVENARFIVEDNGADYVFPVKQNQGNLFETIRNIEEDDFSPSMQNN